MDKEKLGNIFLYYKEKKTGNCMKELKIRNIKL